MKSRVQWRCGRRRNGDRHGLTGASLLGRRVTSAIRGLDMSVVKLSKFVPKMAAVGVLLGVVGVIGSGGSAYGSSPAPAEHSRAVADASPGKDVTVAHRGTPKPPPGYTVVTGDWLANAGYTSGALASCPQNTTPFGGGAEVSSDSLDVNMTDSSFTAEGPPDAFSWETDVNNASESDTTITAYAVCGDSPAGYRNVVPGSVDNPAGSQTEAAATCPRGTALLGGGALFGDQSLLHNLNSSYPSVHGKSSAWVVYMNNASGYDNIAQAEAVCGKKPKGYRVVTGSAVDNPAGEETAAAATCPGRTVPLSGGVYSDSNDLSVNINSSYPISNSWFNFENNASGVDDTITPYVICAS